MGAVPRRKPFLLYRWLEPDLRLADQRHRTLIILYSGGYLKGHPQQGRFIAFMFLFMGSMLGVVMADNLIALFVYWELTSITSFLLIGFDHNREGIAPGCHSGTGGDRRRRTGVAGRC